MIRDVCYVHPFVLVCTSRSRGLCESDLRRTVGERVATYFEIRSDSLVGPCRVFRSGTLSPDIRAAGVNEEKTRQRELLL